MTDLVWGGVPGSAGPGQQITQQELPWFCLSLVPAWESQMFMCNLKEKLFCWCELLGNKTRKGTAVNKSKLITRDNKPCCSDWHKAILC